VHPHRKVPAFDVAGRDVLFIRRSRNRVLLAYLGLALDQGRQFKLQEKHFVHQIIPFKQKVLFVFHALML
jgi:hypothetical protein